MLLLTTSTSTKTLTISKPKIAWTPRSTRYFPRLSCTTVCSRILYSWQGARRLCWVLLRARRWGRGVRARGWFMHLGRRLGVGCLKMGMGMGRREKRKEGGWRMRVIGLLILLLRWRGAVTVRRRLFRWQVCRWLSSLFTFPLSYFHLFCPSISHTVLRNCLVLTSIYYRWYSTGSLITSCVRTKLRVLWVYEETRLLPLISTIFSVALTQNFAFLPRKLMVSHGQGFCSLCPAFVVIFVVDTTRSYWLWELSGDGADSCSKWSSPVKGTFYTRHNWSCFECVPTSATNVMAPIPMTDPSLIK